MYTIIKKKKLEYDHVPLFRNIEINFNNKIKYVDKYDSDNLNKHMTIFK